MLPKKFRLTRDKDLKKVFSRGKSFFAPPFKLKILKNDLGVSRFAIVVSNQVAKKATQRNKLKRQLREIIRLYLTEIKPGYDLVLIARPKILTYSFQQIKKAISSIFIKTKLL